MAETRPEFVLRFQNRGLFYALYGLAVLATLWMALVLFGESENWGDDPGRWAGLPSFYWALVASLFLALFIIYSLAVLVIRERPGRVYRIQGADEVEPASTPSFLQPAASEPASAPSESTPPGQP